MKALVTGVAGFVGSHLATALLAEGREVVGIDAFTDYYAREIKEANLAPLRRAPRFRFIEGALQRTDLPRALEGVSHVFHLAGQPGVRKSWGRDFASYTSDNVEATQHLLEAVKGRPIERLVYASSSSVYGDDVAIPMREDARVAPVSPYGVTKLAAEHLCHLYAVNYDVPAVSLRYFTVYGPRQRPDMAFHRFITAAFTDRPVALYGDGAQTRDFTFVADVVAATIAAGDRGLPGAVYNIGGGSRVSVNDVLRLVEQVTGRALRVDRVPSQKGDMRDTFADTSRARAEIGFAPTVALADGLAAETAWLAPLLPASRR
jgi:nucleoside-diphosphate-sugar epimerase